MDHDALEQAYIRGDHRTARRLAQGILKADGEPEQLSRAREILAATTPDLFLVVVGALGLSLVLWLVYYYVL